MPVRTERFKPETNENEVAMDPPMKFKTDTKGKAYRENSEPRKRMNKIGRKSICEKNDKILSS